MSRNYKKLGDYSFVTKLAGFEHSKYFQFNATHEVNDIPCIQGKNIRNGKVTDDFDWYISKEISDALPRSVLNKRCIVIPYVGSKLGELAIFDKNFVCHLASNVAKVELTDETLDLDYLYYYLKSPFGQGQLFRDKQGSAQPNITMEAIRETKVTFFEKTYQQKIASVLSALDSKIELNNRINAELEAIAKTLYDYWFVQFDFPDANGKPYKSNGGIMVWNEELKREVPEGWEVKKIENFCRIFTGKKDVNQALETGKYKFFSCSPNYKFSNDKLFEGKAILISGNGSYTGRTIFVDEGFDLYQRTYACVNKTESDILPYLYYSILRFLSLKICGGTHGSAIPYIVYDDIAKETFSYNYDIVSRFQDIIDPILTKINSTNNQTTKLIELRDWLLPMLMNGQVRVDAMEDDELLGMAAEPAVAYVKSKKK